MTTPAAAAWLGDYADKREPSPGIGRGVYIPMGRIARELEHLVNQDAKLSEQQKGYVSSEIRHLALWKWPWGYRTRFLLLLTFINTCRG